MMTIVRLLALMGMTLLPGCVPGSAYVPTQFPPNPKYTNVKPEEPVVVLEGFVASQPSISDFSNAGLEYRNRDDDYVHSCGTPVQVSSTEGAVVHGRLFLFAYADQGLGPAGRGDYLVQVSDEQIQAVSGGRRSVAWEMYRTSPNLNANVAPQGRLLAWAIVMSDRPLSCQ